MANIDTVRSYVDYEIQGLMKPVVKNLDEALRTYKSSASDNRRVILMKEIDANITAIFGGFNRAQFSPDGKGLTPAARLLVKQISSAAMAGGESKEAVEAAIKKATTRRDPAGRTMGDSVYNAGNELRHHVRDLVAHHLEKDTPIEQVVAQLNDYLAAPRNKKRDLTVVGQDGRYAIRRLANNEVNVAHGDAVIGKAGTTGGAVVKWVLASKGHPQADECDRFAHANDFGLGDGIYLPHEVPRYPAHVGCKCTLQIVMLAPKRPAPPPPPEPPTPPTPPPGPTPPEKKKRNTDTPAYRRRAEEAARKRAEKEAAKQGQGNKKSSNEAERLRKQAEENARKHQEEVEQEKERQRIERRKLLDELERKEREKVIKREAARKKREEEATRKAQEERDRLQREADERTRLAKERLRQGRNEQATQKRDAAKQAVTGKDIPPPTKPRTAKEAEDYARNVLGIKNARYDDAAIGHLLNQGFHEMKVAGYTLLDNVTISERAFKPGSNAIAHYDPRIDAIVANPKAPYWRNAAKVAKDAKRRNWWTNDHPMQVIFHEMGHKQHWDRMTAAYGTGSMRSMTWNAWGDASAFPSTFKGSVASKGLSKYGHTNPLELVAEVYSGWVAGRRDYPPELIAVYNSFLGPKLLP